MFFFLKILVKMTFKMSMKKERIIDINVTYLTKLGFVYISAVGGGGGSMSGLHGSYIRY